jgi:NAD(P)-dependent dehydrogenase (short-subunit alcohol dehydrogenase family)
MELSGTSAVVTGGASGLGLATVHRLRKRGVEVVVLDIESSAGADVAEETGAHFVSGDVRDEGSAEAAVARAVAIAPLRVVVNCAGVGMAGRTVGRSAASSSTRLPRRRSTVSRARCRTRHRRRPSPG